MSADLSHLHPRRNQRVEPLRQLLEVHPVELRPGVVKETFFVVVVVVGGYLVGGRGGHVGERAAPCCRNRRDREIGTRVRERPYRNIIRQSMHIMPRMFRPSRTPRRSRCRSRICRDIWQTMTIVPNKSARRHLRLRVINGPGEADPESDRRDAAHELREHAVVGEPANGDAVFDRGGVEQVRADSGGRLRARCSRGWWRMLRRRGPLPPFLVPIQLLHFHLHLY